MKEYPVDVSLVVPIYNEADNLAHLYERVTRVMEGYGRSYEFILVDDGSSDDSLKILRELRAQDERVRIVTLLRNFGQTPALYAGFAAVQGRVVVMLDGDLQNPPEEIPKLIEKIDAGFDAVSGWRVDRQDSLHRKIISRILNAFVARLTNTNMHDWGCSLKAFSREFVDRLNMFSHHSRYLPADIGWLTNRVAEVRVEHEPRREGSTKYTPFVLVRTAFDLLTSLTAAPLQWIGIIGGVLAFMGFVIAAGAGVATIMGFKPGILGLMAALMFFLTGVQLVCTGLLCEYVSRIFIEVQNKPLFIIKDEN